MIFIRLSAAVITALILFLPTAQAKSDSYEQYYKTCLTKGQWTLHQNQKICQCVVKVLKEKVDEPTLGRYLKTKKPTNAAEASQYPQDLLNLDELEYSISSSCVGKAKKR